MRPRRLTKAQHEAAVKLQEWVVAHHGWIHVKSRLNHDCYALAIGDHKHTVVRTRVHLFEVSSRLVAKFVSADYYPHLATLIMAAKSMGHHPERAAGVRPVDSH